MICLASASCQVSWRLQVPQQSLQVPQHLLEGFSSLVGCLKTAITAVLLSYVMYLCSSTVRTCAQQFLADEWASCRVCMRQCTFSARQGFKAATQTCTLRSTVQKFDRTHKQLNHGTRPVVDALVGMKQAFPTQATHCLVCGTCITL